MSAKTTAIIGALSMVLAIALGAFAAHGLKTQLSAYSLDVYKTAASYHAWHSIGLILIASYAHNQSKQNQSKPSSFTLSAVFLIVGIVLFSGSLYLLSITQQTWLGMITPLGGVSFMLGWLAFAWAIWRT